MDQWSNDKRKQTVGSTNGGIPSNAWILNRRIVWNEYEIRIESYFSANFRFSISFEFGNLWCWCRCLLCTTTVYYYFLQFATLSNAYTDVSSFDIPSLFALPSTDHRNIVVVVVAFSHPKFACLSGIWHCQQQRNDNRMMVSFCLFSFGTNGFGFGFGFVHTQNVSFSLRFLSHRCLSICLADIGWSRTIENETKMLFIKMTRIRAKNVNIVNGELDVRPRWTADENEHINYLRRFHAILDPISMLRFRDYRDVIRKKNSV